MAQGRSGYSGEPVVTTLVCFFIFAREAAGATGTRLSLRPLLSRRRIMHNSDASRRGIEDSCGATSLRGAQATKQTILSLRRYGLLRSARNDVEGAVRALAHPPPG